MMAFWILALLCVALLAAGPWWPYSRGWGFAPIGVALAALLLWLLILWMGWVPYLQPFTPTMVRPVPP